MFDRNDALDSWRSLVEIYVHVQNVPNSESSVSKRAHNPPGLTAICYTRFSIHQAALRYITRYYGLSFDKRVALEPEEGQQECCFKLCVFHQNMMLCLLEGEPLPCERTSISAGTNEDQNVTESPLMDVVPDESCLSVDDSCLSALDHLDSHIHIHSRWQLFYKTEKCF